MPLMKNGSKEAVGHNIKELRKAGHPIAQSIAISLSNQRKYKKMAMGGMVDNDAQGDSEGTVTPLVLQGEKEADNAESMGQEQSDNRDAFDQGSKPKPAVAEDVDQGSPEHTMDTDMPLSDEIMAILKKRKAKFSQE